ncbi:MAG: glycosyltransferase family 4 protein [Planctomycetales bacterium]|nr:glycosyltransferase family 4 protein [Planctomycetales bacterium]
MRIAHIITRLILGGAQENTLLNCLDLRERYGDDVLLITGPGLGPEGSLEDRARRAGLPLRVISQLRRAIHPTRDWLSYRDICAALREFKPQVVHTHSGKAGLLGRRAAWTLRVPAVVHTIHGAPFHRFQGRGARMFFQACERYAAHRCHRLISVADAMTEQMVAANIAERNKFVTVYSGMEIDPFLSAHSLRNATRAELGLAPDDVVVGKIARFFRLKGHDDFLKAAKLILRDHPRAKFVLVGDGVLRPHLERQLEEQGLCDAFRLTGLVDPQRIPALLAATDVVVHTSLREGLARVLPQALLVGRPVVSYDIDGAREVVIDGKTGFLASARDVSRVANCVSKLLSDAGLRQQLAAAGQRLCREMFPVQLMTDAIRRIYEQILEVPAHARGE